MRLERWCELAKRMGSLTCWLSMSTEAHLVRPAGGQGSVGCCHGRVSDSLSPTVGLIVSHLPFGPTAYFTLCNVVMRHDIPDLGTMSEAKPHLITHGFSSRLGKRVSISTLWGGLRLRPAL